jgi:hypothetical protein
VTKNHYRPFFEAVVAMAEHISGPSWTSQSAAAWREATEWFAAVMAAAAAEPARLGSGPRAAQVHRGRDRRLRLGSTPPLRRTSRTSRFRHHAGRGSGVVTRSLTLQG